LKKYTWVEDEKIRVFDHISFSTKFRFFGKNFDSRPNWISTKFLILAKFRFLAKISIFGKHFRFLAHIFGQNFDFWQNNRFFIGIFPIEKLWNSSPLRIDSSNTGNCTYFPPEFSLILTFKPSRIDSRNQYLLSLIPRDNKQIKFAIRLHWDSIYFDYVTDDQRGNILKRKERIHILVPEIHDGHWHTMIISVSNDQIRILFDCGEKNIL